MIKKYIGSICMLILLLASCSQDDLMKYDLSTHSLYIPIGDKTARIDTAFFSFKHHLNVDEYKVRFLVKLNGPLLEEDKTFKVEVLEEKTTALPEDYTLATEQTFHAGVWEDSIYITLHRTPHLATDLVRLTIRLVPNDHFDVAPYIGDTNFNTISRETITASISFCDMISKPEWWDERITNFYLGEYSDNKYRYFIISSGVTDLTGYSSTEIREMLIKFKDDISDNNWTESDGSLITIVIN